MIPSIDYFKDDFDQIAIIMEKHFNLRAGHLNDFMEIDIESTKEIFYPLLLLASYRLLSNSKEPPYHMAAVIYFINMATNIHKYEGQFPQYPVLIGDYIYAKFFSFLSEYKSMNWLKPLSKVICSIHEGGIERRQYTQKGLGIGIETLSKEFAYLSSISCEIGASYAQSSEVVINTMKEIGLCLGTAWAIRKEILNASQYQFQTVHVRNYLEKAHELLSSLSNIFVNYNMFTVFEEIIYNLDNNVNTISSNKVV